MLRRASAVVLYLSKAEFEVETCFLVWIIMITPILEISILVSVFLFIVSFAIGCITSLFVIRLRYRGFDVSIVKLMSDLRIASCMENSF